MLSYFSASLIFLSAFTGKKLQSGYLDPYQEGCYTADNSPSTIHFFNLTSQTVENLQSSKKYYGIGRLTGLSVTFDNLHSFLLNPPLKNTTYVIIASSQKKNLYVPLLQSMQFFLSLLVPRLRKWWSCWISHVLPFSLYRVYSIHGGCKLQAHARSVVLFSLSARRQSFAA